MIHERLLVDVAKRFGISLNMHAGGQRPLKLTDDMKLKSREKNKITRLNPEYKKLMSELAKESMIKNPDKFKKFLDSNNNYKESLKKKVIDIDSKEIWDSALECSEFLKCHHTTVEKACKKLNRAKKCKGRNLMYYNDFLKIEGRDE